ncbi:MAG: hypothetical protein A2Z34_05980 [Planctomycetes bacterium RBG_16_59_8]|nr:MAG: hypothetical protein A2Z34_05980 [Planctomycetes bacterium RBG_16_59_8]
MKMLTTEWIGKAEEDFLVAQRELKTNPPAYDAVCFHSQQCVEKYLKAVLQEANVPFGKTHDLDVLLEQCKAFIPEIAALKRELLELSAFAVEIRYPGVSATDKDATENPATADAVRGAIRKFFKT